MDVKVSVTKGSIRDPSATSDDESLGSPPALRAYASAPSTLIPAGRATSLRPWVELMRKWFYCMM